MGTADVAATRSPRRASTRAEMALFGVYEIAKVLTVPLRLEGALASVLRLLSSFLDMNNGLIALLSETGEAEVVVGSGGNEASARRFFDSLPERVVGQIVATRMPLVVENAERDPLFAGCDLSEWRQGGGRSAFIGVPIKDRDHVIGTLTIDRDATSAAGVSGFDDDVRFLTMCASLIGQTVRLHRIMAQDRERLFAEQSRLAKSLAARTGLDQAARVAGIVGDSPAIRDVLEKLRIVARSHSTVLLRGESGTGKELFARALHSLSPRKDKAFVAVNCAALPETVLESELFGHEKGAFTGAMAQRKGRFELADGGTLFLDEIGEISPLFQVKLLRVLQEGTFERVGGSQTLKVDVRVVAATNRNLEEAVAKGDFRADLYYRINVVPIFLPPLRDRPTDVPVLAREFLRRFNDENGTGLELTDAAVHVLSSCYFPGNVRELENCVRRTATLAHGTNIGAEDFACRHDQCMSAMLWPSSMSSRADYTPLPIAAPPNAGVRPPAAPRACPPPGEPCPAAAAGGDVRLDRERLVDAMEKTGWIQAKAARLLGLTARQMGYALRKHNIPIKRL